MIPRFVYPPIPTEEGLTTLVRRDVLLKSTGRVFRLELGQWHWDMLEFHNLWNEKYNREQGFVEEMCKRGQHAEDRIVSAGIMMGLRKDYAEWTKKLPEGERPRFIHPLSTPKGR